jgi:hypothetical protein
MTTGARIRPRRPGQRSTRTPDAATGDFSSPLRLASHGRHPLPHLPLPPRVVASQRPGRPFTAQSPPDEVIWRRVDGTVEQTSAPFSTMESVDKWGSGLAWRSEAIACY